MSERTVDTPDDALREVLFRIGEEVYDRADVVLAAHLGGEWEVLGREVREGLACQARLAADECSIDEAAVKEMATEFRYARKLLSADETRAWLAQRQIKPGDWMDFIRRTRLRLEAGSQLAEIVQQYPVADDALHGHLLCEAICSGRFETVGRRLAGRAAVHAGAVEEGGASPIVAIPAESAGVAVATDLGLPLEEGYRRLARLQRIDHDFERWCTEIATSAAVAAQIRDHQLDWIKVDLSIAHFDEASSAEEAIFCTRDDGMALSEVAASAGIRYERIADHLDKVDTALRDRLLGAGRGDVLGPLQHEGRFAVVVIENKVLPSGDDAAIQLRARASLLASAVQRELNERVVWEAGL